MDQVSVIILVPTNHTPMKKNLPLISCKVPQDTDTDAREPRRFWLGLVYKTGECLMSMLKGFMMPFFGYLNSGLPK